jgi:hypothetical protein
MHQPQTLGFIGGRKKKNQAKSVVKSSCSENQVFVVINAQNKKTVKSSSVLAVAKLFSQIR